MNSEAIAVIGAGLIGRSWAISFARGGYSVRLFDVAPGALVNATKELEVTVQALALAGLLGTNDASTILGRVHTTGDLAMALRGAVHAQENAPESLSAKVALFKELDDLADPQCTLASSTSALLPSSFSSKLRHRERVLVAHPLNPPHLVPAVELVPAPWTSDATMSGVARVMETCGQVPIRLRQELPGFIMNRLQGALLHEAFRLIDGGFANVEDVDAAVRDGLGMRWSFMGPFETIDLNAPGGVADFIERYGPAYEAIGQSQGRTVSWKGAVANEVTSSRRAALPASRIKERQSWRDEELARLADHRRRAPDRKNTVAVPSGD